MYQDDNRESDDPGFCYTSVAVRWLSLVSRAVCIHFAASFLNLFGFVHVPQ